MYDYSISEDVNLNLSKKDIDLSYYSKNITDKSIEELAAENVILRAKLLANIQVLKDKKRILVNDKSIKELETKLKLPRKVFAFRVIFFNKPSIDTVNKALEFITKESNGKLLKQFVINDYIYVKVNRNTYFTSHEYEVPEQCKLIQIDPKNIFK